MKSTFKWRLGLLGVLLSNIVFAQVHTDVNGNVGIGTVNPQTKLQVAGGQIAATVDDNLAGFTQLWSDNAIIWKHSSFNGGIRFGSATNLAAAGWSEKMKIADNGNVGIGISSPESRLHLLQNENQIGLLLQSSSTGWGSGMVFRNTATSGKSYGFYSSAWGGFHLVDQTAGVDRMFVSPSGNVGVGTSSVNESGFRFYVEGGVRARKIKVDQTAWADFVFAPTYQLRSLSEVKSFIQLNGHLPDVPSKKEVVENGQDLGEMNKILLQKIEELTLYMIEMKAELDELKSKKTNK